MNADHENRIFGTWRTKNDWEYCIHNAHNYHIDVIESNLIVADCEVRQAEFAVGFGAHYTGGLT